MIEIYKEHGIYLVKRDKLEDGDVVSIAYYDGGPICVWSEDAAYYDGQMITCATQRIMDIGEVYGKLTPVSEDLKEYKRHNKPIPNKVDLSGYDSIEQKFIRNRCVSTGRVTEEEYEKLVKEQ